MQFYQESACHSPICQTKRILIVVVTQYKVKKVFVFVICQVTMGIYLCVHIGRKGKKRQLKGMNRQKRPIEAIKVTKDPKEITMGKKGKI